MTTLKTLIPAKRDKTVAELGCKLGPLGTDLKGKRKGELQSLATLSSIDIQKTVETETTEGWLGKPKGVLQILWE